MTDDIRKTEARLALADTVQDLLDRLETAYALATSAGYVIAVDDLISRTEALADSLLSEIHADVLDLHV